jgi:hypothetical protein
MTLLRWLVATAAMWVATGCLILWALVGCGDTEECHEPVVVHFVQHTRPLSTNGVRRSYEAAAQILKVPVGTVRSRLSRSRDTLRRLMDLPERWDQATPSRPSRPGQLPGWRSRPISRKMRAVPVRTAVIPAPHLHRQSVSQMPQRPRSY